MAAVAGSKGRISLSEGENGYDGFVNQAHLAAKVLSHEMTVERAAEALLKNAKLREVGVDTNMVCNLSCSYCYLNDREEAKGTANLTEVSAFLSECIDLGAKLVAFIGKEPLADKRALTLAAGLKAHKARANFRTGMVTNGTLIERRIDTIKSAELNYLDVSMDGFEGTNDLVRGAGAFSAAMNGLRLAANEQLAPDLAVTSVLHQKSLLGYTEFVAELFDLGITTCFSSPVLNFATSNQSGVVPLALQMDGVVRHYENLVQWAHKNGTRLSEGRQIMVDLPYRHSWKLLADGNVQLAHIIQDEYEAHHWQPDPNVPVFVKLNFVPQSYWRAFRLTHDGRCVFNMDLAAHRNYHQVSDLMSDKDRAWWNNGIASEGQRVLTDFFAGMLGVLSQGKAICDRDIEGQLRNMKPSLAA